MVRNIFGTLGLLALIAAIVIGALAALGILSDAPTQFGVGKSEAEIAPASARTEHVTKTFDKFIKAGDLTWEIGKVSRVSKIKTYNYPPSTIHGNFLVINFSVTNTSDLPITLSDDSMVLKDTTGLEDRPAASVNSSFVVPSKNILFEKEGLLEPGEKKEGTVHFDLSVPFGTDPEADLKGFSLTLGDGDPTVDKEKELKLDL